MSWRTRAEHPGGATELRCPECGSEKIECQRDATLVATVLELRDGVLILSGPLVPQPLDCVQLVCAECGADLPGVGWSQERPRHVPRDERPLSDAEALDRLAEELNGPGDWNGGDVSELAADLLRCTGCRIEDEPDSVSPQPGRIESDLCGRAAEPRQPHRAGSTGARPDAEPPKGAEQRTCVLT